MPELSFLKDPLGAVRLESGREHSKGGSQELGQEEAVVTAKTTGHGVSGQGGRSGGGEKWSIS